MKPLTDREWEVMQLIAQGYQNKQVAEILKCAIKTIEKHRTSIYYKWSVNGAIPMIRVAMRTGAVSRETFLGSSIGESTRHHRPQHIPSGKV